MSNALFVEVDYCALKKQTSLNLIFIYYEFYAVYVKHGYEKIVEKTKVK